MSVIFAIFGYFFVTTISKEFTLGVERSFDDKWKREMNDIELWFSKRRNDFSNYVDIIRSSPEFTFVQDTFNIPETRSSIKENFNLFLFHYPVFFQISLADAQTGDVVVSSDSNDEKTSIKDKPYFQEAEKGFVMTKVMTNSSGKHVIYFAAPVISSTGIRMILTATANAFALNDIFNDETSKNTERYYLIAEDRIPFGGFPDSTPDNNVQDLVINRALNGSSEHDIYIRPDGEEVIGYYGYSKEYGIILVVQEPTSMAFAPFYGMAKQIGTLMFLLMIAGILVIFWLSRRITIPLSKLTEAARFSYGGNFKKPNINTKDEIGVLGEAFSKMTDNLLNTSKEREMTMEMLPYPIYTLDQSGKIIETNRMAEKLSGLARKDITGKSIFDIIEKPDGINYVQDLFKDNDWFEINSFHISNGHKKFPISISGSVIKDNGYIKHYVFIAKDLRDLKKYAKQRIDELTPIIHRISLGDFSQRVELPKTQDEFTDLLVSIDYMAANLEELISENRNKTQQIKLSEQKLQNINMSLRRALGRVEEEKAKAESILSNMGEGLMVIDPKGYISLINHTAEQMFQKNSKSVLGKIFSTVYTFKNEKDQTILVNTFPIANAIKRNKRIFSNDFFVRSDGSEMPLATTTAPIFLGTKLFGIVITFRDITKEREVDRAKSEFVSIASHQLRTPLTGIRWLIEAVLKKGHLTVWQMEFLQDALQSNNRMIRLVNDLLNLSRLETGAISIKPKEINLVDFLNDMVRDYKAVAEESQKTLILKSDINKSMVSCDPQLLNQVVANLISNAIKYTRPKTKVTVYLKNIHDKVNIAVEDKGIGIPEDDQKHLFTKFFRSEQAIKMSTSGSGLGLYIVKKILESLGGEIHCSSTEGKGSVFEFSIPRHGMEKKGSKGLVGWKIS